MIATGQLGRYNLIRKIGEGAFGSVFEANDPLYDGHVALKVLRRNQVGDVARFKQEFRSLADITHRNLVRLFELAVEQDTWYFTMELLDGSSFTTYVSDGFQAVPGITATAITGADHVPLEPSAAEHPVDVGRLRAALRELALGVQALHRAGKLHCDIKPSNVMVTRAGRVVLLDFGLITDIDTTLVVGRSIAGTPGYIAPECTLRQCPSPASDWFSVGALLHEVLTGQRYFNDQALRKKSFDPETRELGALCQDLLRANPDQRPRGAEILRRLGADDRVDVVGEPVAAHAPFVGRQAELGQLEAAWQDALRESGAALVRVVGTSGAGKTALVRQFLDQLAVRHPEALILTGRCYEAEAMPYKAVDSLMDALGRYLAELPPEELQAILPRGAALLARLFRVFETVTQSGDFEAEDDFAESQSQRRRAFALLREITKRIAERRRLVLFIDDVHWGDVDSAKLMAELLRAPHSPSILVIIAHRPSASPSGFVAALDELPSNLEARRLELGQLTPEEAAAMAGHLLDATQAVRAAQIASEAAGSPIFIQQLAEQANSTARPDGGSAADLNQLIVNRVAGLEREARQLLETIAVAAQPIPERVALDAAELSASPGRAALTIVRQVRLVMTRNDADVVLLEPVHDRIREAVNGVLDADAKRQVHARLARALLANGRAEPETLLRHFVGAGDTVNTRSYALLAAERAEAALAFDRAANHYQVVINLTPETDPARHALLTRWAEALASAGRASEASDAFQHAADTLGRTRPDSGALLELSRRAGELALRSGRLAVGTQRMHAALRKVGISPPETRARAAALSVWRRSKLFIRGLKVRDVQPTPQLRARLDVLWGASTSISLMNYVVADALGLQHLLEALEGGERSHVVRALGYEAAFEAVIGGRFIRRRCEKILAQMDDLASASAEPYDQAWALMSRGVTAWFVGDWVTTWKYADAASTLYREQCRGVAWELAVCDAYRLPALAYLGDLPRLAELVPSALERALERGDLFAASTLRMGQQSLIFLVRDQPEEAINQAHAACAGFGDVGYLLQHYHHLFAYVQASLYTGDAREAWRRIEHDWPALKQARLLVSQYLRVEIRQLRARTALTLLAAGHSVPGQTPATLRELVREDARLIARDDAIPCAGLSAALEASLAALEGDARGATRLLRRAIKGFDAAHMAPYAEAARRRLGRMLDDDEGRALCARADSWMRTRGIVNPPAMVRMLVPAFAD